VRLNFCGPTPANKGFKPMVRDGRFDAGELAIVTFLQALEYGKPLALTPAVVLAHLQHPFLVYNAERRGPVRPKDLEGARIAARAYTQTTGAWIRGFLAHDFGVDLDAIAWACWDDPHPAEYRDPANVERVPSHGPSLNDMLLDGTVDAGIPAADLLANPALKPVFPEPAADAQAWHEKNDGAWPINHMFVVRKELCQKRPDIVRELWRMLKASKTAAPASKDGIDRTRFGVEANRSSLERIIQYSLEQKLITRRFSVDDLFDDVTRALE
jgi:4,5-dihydroxyphthalate decarboxylase